MPLGPDGAGRLRVVCRVGLLCVPVGGGLPAVVACGPTGVSGAGGPDLSGRAALCARGRWPARSPSALRASLGASSRSPARPRHRPRPPQPGPPVPPAPSTPVVPGRCCLVRRVLLQTSSIRAAYCAVFPVLVTNVVNPAAFLRKIVVFGLRLTTFVTRVLVRRFELRWFDDVCNVGRPLIARPGPAAARSSPVEWCNRFVSFGVGYALSWSGGSSCPVGWGVSRDLVRMSRLR